MDETTTISLYRPRRTSTSMAQGTSLFAQLNVPRQSVVSAPVRRNRLSQAFQIHDDEQGNALEEQVGHAASASQLRRARASGLRGGLDTLREIPTSSMPAIAEGNTAATPPIRREPRRRTIFVPSDDTTMLTIHPGMKGREDSTRLDKIAEPAEEIMASPKATDLRPARPRRPARTSILAAPRRGPLQTMQPQQQTGNGLDHDGQATGKENLAPGNRRVSVLGGKGGQLDLVEKPLPPAARSRMSLAHLDAVNTSACSARSQVSMAARRESLLSVKPSTSNHTPKKPSVRTTSPEQQGRAKVARLAASTTIRQPTCSRPTLNLRNYPPLQEDIAHARMFEESWLSNQESVLVELINDVFSRAEAGCTSPKHQLLRERMLQSYQDKATLRLHQRLQASLQFGTLSLPKESDCMPEAYRYAKDVGRRQRFIKLWTQAYQPKFLRAALEVVTGRQTTSILNEACTVRDLTYFIEGFLLRNDDAHAPSHLHNDAESTGWAWRRTMQRALMLVYVLDQAKEALNLDGTLFRRASPFKCSRAVLSELASILHPSEKNIAQCLNHLGYKLTHEQHPLADFAWPVNNLAVDLRDGIRLARLVELLLPPWQPPNADLERRWSSASETDATATDPISAARFLAPHLRVPATHRTAMLANNELVLQAMRSGPSLDPAARVVTAADLVDGHREKTLALLWALVGTAGLQRLVDWSDVEAEVQALKAASANSEVDTSTCGTVESVAQLSEDAEPYRALLHQWTAVIAAKHGLSVPNLSTAFADGRIFECLVDEYTPLLPAAPAFHGSGVAGRAPLEGKLLRLCCSASFASIFGGAGTTPFLDAPFVTASLLFLASRLLGGSRAERDRRKALRSLATDCATVVGTRQRVELAAVTLQQAWRGMVRRRKDKIAGDREMERREKKERERSLLAKEVDVEFWMV